MTTTRYRTTAVKPRQFVYYLLGADGAALYVGRSSDVVRRIGQHNRHAEQPENPIYGGKAAWFFDVRSVSMVGPMSWAQAIVLERQEITRLQPRGNVRHTRRDSWLKANRQGVSA